MGEVLGDNSQAPCHIQEERRGSFQGVEGVAREAETEYYHLQGEAQELLDRGYEKEEYALREAALSLQKDVQRSTSRLLDGEPEQNPRLEDMTGVKIVDRREEKPRRHNCSEQEDVVSELEECEVTCPALHRSFCELGSACPRHGRAMRERGILGKGAYAP